MALSGRSSRRCRARRVDLQEADEDLGQDAAAGEPSRRLFAPPLSPITNARSPTGGLLRRSRHSAAQGMVAWEDLNLLRPRPPIKVVGLEKETKRQPKS